MCGVCVEGEAKVGLGEAVGEDGQSGWLWSVAGGMCEEGGAVVGLGGEGERVGL
jgi:hypothetical protein